jgi:hypothetical protein
MLQVLPELSHQLIFQLTLRLRRHSLLPQSPPTRPPISKWHIYSVGYVWLPGINGTAGILGYNEGVHVSVWDLLSKFRFGIVGTFIPSYNRWSIPTDFVWMRLKDDKAIAFNPAYSIQAKATASIFNPKVTYLVVKSPKVKVYGNVGLRYWHLGTTLNLEPPGPLGRSLYGSANWVD